MDKQKVGMQYIATVNIYLMYRRSEKYLGKTFKVLETLKVFN